MSGNYRIGSREYRIEDFCRKRPVRCVYSKKAGFILLPWLFPIFYRLKNWRGKLKIEVQLDEHCSEVTVRILTDRMSREVQELMDRITLSTTDLLLGFQKEEAVPLSLEEIIRVYTSDGKVYAVTEEGEYQLRYRLYEVEERVNPKYFVRISQSEIVNLRKVKRFDLSLTGTIGVLFSDGSFSYVSRRFVSKIKQCLEIGGRK